MPSKSVAERLEFEKYLKSGQATLGRVYTNYPRGSWHCGMLRLARLIRAENFRVPGVVFGLAPGDRTLTSSSSYPLRDELVELAKNQPNTQIIFVSEPAHRSG